jgi:hypothetical protein
VVGEGVGVEFAEEGAGEEVLAECGEGEERDGEEEGHGDICNL